MSAIRYYLLSTLVYIAFGVLAFSPEHLRAQVPTVRVTEDLKVLYTFNQGGDPSVDPTVYDVSGVVSPLDLAIEDPANASRTLDGGLLIGPSTRVSNPADDNKIYTSCTAANELTVEAWIVPDTTTFGGPARIVTQSLDGGNRNFTLAQGPGVYEARLRTTTNGNNGTFVTLIGASASTELQHVVFTRDADGNAVLYVNGGVADSATIGGNLSNWNATYDFGLANEFSAASTATARDWLGEYRLVAVYCRALSAAEVEQNYDAGTSTPTCAADDDCDGLPNGDDPCPADARNFCFGPVAMDTSGTDIRINANVSSAECTGLKVDCSGDVWYADFGWNQNPEASTCDLGGGGEACVISGITTLFGCEDEETEDIFQCDHWDGALDPELVYDFAVDPGTYLVNLLFANTNSSTVTEGSRVFDIRIQGDLVYDDFDQVAAAGGSGIAVVRSAVVTVGEGESLQIEFEHNEPSSGDPAVKGIEVLAQAECAVDADCDDGVFCNGTEVCDAFACEAGTPEDDNTPCDDGVACTVNDTCQEEVCTGTPDHVQCDSGLGCINDFCDAVLGCVADPVAAGESCEADADLCTFDECDGAGLCANVGDVTCDPGVACDPGTGFCESGSIRVTEGLEVLYTFDQGVGATVEDVSGEGDPLNLTVEDPANASRTPDGGLLIGPATRVSNPADDNKIYTSCTAANELTVEAWIVPDTTTFGGPARIVTQSLDGGNRNFTLAQGPGVYEVRLRTTTNGNNGSSVRLYGASTTTLQHVVFTRDADGNAVLYVNGGVADSATIGGNLSNWNATYDFGLANEFSAASTATARDWLGEYRLVAVYCKALTVEEVGQNYDAGPDGLECVDDLDCDDGAFCNGAETCDVGTGICQAGTPEADGTACGDPSDTSCDNPDSCLAGACEDNFEPVDTPCPNSLFCDGAETCDGGGVCEDGPDPCDPATETCNPGGTCEPIIGCSSNAECADGNLCNGVETCVTGVCQPGTPVTCDPGVACDPGTGFCESGSIRVTEGLEVLYTFDQGVGATVEDVSGEGDPLDLTVEDPANASRTPDGGLLIGPATRVSNPADDNKIYTSCTAANELTVEAWIVPDTTTFGGPARIVTQSLDGGNRNFTLAQGPGVYEVRLRTTTNGNNGSSVRLYGASTTTLQHVVFTRDADGNAVLYVNGGVADSATIGGNLSNWNATYDFGLANEFSAASTATARDWLGEYRLVAVYCKALTVEEVGQNYDAGPDGLECVDDLDCDDGAFCNGAETCDVGTGICQAGTPEADGTACGDPSDTSCDNPDSCLAGACEDNFEPVDTPCPNSLFCDGAETCDGGGVCEDGPDPCDPATETCNPGGTCEPIIGCSSNAECADGNLCNGVETCVTGVCQPGTPVTCDPGVACDPGTGFCESGSIRVTEGLEVLYTFDQGVGATVEDVSGEGDPLNLTVEDPANASRTPDGGLLIGPATRVSNPADDNKIYTSCTAANELTVEAWIVPDTTTFGGPARIVTQSLDGFNRNFTLAQGPGVYEARLRTTTNGNNGNFTVLLSAAASATTGLQHVVFTRDSAGDATLFIDGVGVDSDVIGGDFSNWNPAYDFGLGNEFSAASTSTNRDWLGEYRLVAVYCKALTAEEVGQNYDAGPDSLECVDDLDCDDGAFCNGAETCDVGTGICQAGTPEADDTACVDGVACTVGDTCQAGVCGVPTDVLCDSGTACSNGICDVALGCVAVPVPVGTSCEGELDASLCTFDECDGAGFCANVDAVTCNPGVACDPSTGLCEGDVTFAAYNDLGWGAGQLDQPAVNITKITSPNGDSGLPSTGELVDFSSGAGIGVNLTVTGGNFNGTSHAVQHPAGQSGEPAAGTEAFAVFDGKLTALGSLSYESSPAALPPPDGNLVLTLDGLDPLRDYEVVFYAHRDNYTWQERAALVTISGADGFTNASSVGTDNLGAPLFSGPGDDSTRLPPDNDDGWVARWQQVNPGADGIVVLTVSYDGDGGAALYKGKYANALALLDEGQVRTGETVVFAAIGDYGGDNGNELAVRDVVDAHNADLVITTGDNSYGSTNIDVNIGKYYHNYIGAYSGSFPPGSPVNRFFPSIGNHDYTDGAGITAYLDYFTLPGAGVPTSDTSGNEKYYDVRQGPVHFFAIDSNLSSFGGSDAWRFPDSVQGQWLQDQLAASTAKWKIVYFHHPPYSSATAHGTIEDDNYGAGGHGSMKWPFEDWGVTAVLGGHDHTYERIHKDDNGDGTVLPYFVTGAGGRSLYNFGTPEPGSQVRVRQYGSMIVTADDSTITFEYWSIDGGGGGTLVDTYTVGTPPVGAPDDWVAYNDLDPRVVSGSTQNALNVTAYDYDTSGGILRDFTSGVSLPVTVTGSHFNGDVGSCAEGTGGVDPDDCWDPRNNGDNASGGDAALVFGTAGSRIVDMRATSEIDSADWDNVITFENLDPTKLYAITLSANRANPAYALNRFAKVTIQEVDAAVNASSAGVVINPDGSVSFSVGDNSAGLVAKWTGIDPGADGTFSVKSEWDDTQGANPPDPGGSGPNAKGYAMSAFKLEVDTGPPVVPEYWTSFVDLRATAGDGNAAYVLEIVPNASVPLINPATDWPLLDSDAGAVLPVTMRVDMDVEYSTPNGANAAGGPAAAIFGGVVDSNGGYELHFTDQFVTLTFENLDPSKVYDVALTYNRNGAPGAPPVPYERYSKIAIDGADSATDVSSVAANTDGSITFNSGYNTLNGHVARWTNIDAGTDGTISITTTWDAAAAANPPNSKGYAMTSIRLEALEAPVEPPENWTSYVDLRAEAGDTNAPNVLEIVPSSSYPTEPLIETTDWTLLDYSSGASLPVTMEANVNVQYATTNGANATGGDAAGLFAGIVDGQGGYELHTTGQFVTLTFDNLNPGKVYDVALTYNRDNSAYQRYSRVALAGADSATDISSVAANPDGSITFNGGYNTLNGYVARWTDIDAGADGTISITTTWDDAVVTVPAGLNTKGYAMTSIRIQESDPPPASPPLPIAIGDDWRYFKGTAEPPVGWNDNGVFDDSTWLSGPSGFGYADGDDATVLSDMQGLYSTLYIRKLFNVADPSAISGLKLTVDYDDAFVAYINGSEVARANLTGAPAYNGLADVDHEASGGGATAQPPDVFFFDTSTLEVGDNVIALIGLNKSSGSSDFSLIPSLEEGTPPPPPENWTSYVDLRAEAGDTNAANVLEIIPSATFPTPLNETTDWTLLDYASGASLPVTMEVDMDVAYATPNGANATGGDAAGLFAGVVDGQGGYELHTTGQFVTLTFDNLNPGKVYDVALTYNRNNPAYQRYSRVAIAGADSATDISSVAANPDGSITFNGGYNTLNGYVARWTDIDAGADGTISITTTWDNLVVEDPPNGKGYAMTSIRIEETDPPPPSPPLPIAIGDDWRYFKGTAEPPVGWNDNDVFDDSTWLSGPSGFGYADGDDATVLSDMQGLYSTLYIRKLFNVADPSAVSGLKLTVDYDDAFVAYINGSEVARANLTGAPAYNGLADVDHEASGGGATAQPPDVFFFDTSTLELGDNVIALIGLNKSSGSSDFSLIPSLEEGTPPPPPENWTSYVDLRAEAGDTNAANVLEIIPSATFPTPLNETTDWTLLDYASGASLPVTMEVDMDVAYATPNGANATGGDAAGLFAGVVDGQGGYELHTTGQFVTLTFDNLNPGKVYDVALTYNRNNPAYQRYSRVAIAGADSATDISSVAANPDGSITFNGGYNTLNGYVARWTDIDAGADGTISITTTWDDAVVTVPASLNSKGYAMTSIRIEETDPPPPPPENWTSYVDLRAEAGDGNAANVLEIIPNATPPLIDPATDWPLSDIASGASVPATMQVSMDVQYATPNGANATGGDAAGLFAGIVDGQGGYELHTPGQFVTLTFDNLNPGKVYDVALTYNRNNSAYQRYSRVALAGADSATDISSVAANPDESITFNGGYNTINGYVARWTDIDAGADGTISITTTWDDAVVTDPTTLNSKGYAMTSIRIQETDPPT